MTVTVGAVGTRTKLGYGARAMNARAFFIVISLALVTACGKGRCDASSCDGCCDANGECQRSSATTCGLGGQLCVRCGFAETCNLGICFGGVTGGGSGTTCNSVNCPSGCCDMRGACQPNSTAQCGTAGQACRTCANGGACNGGFCETGSIGGGSGTTGGGAATTGGGSGTSGGGVGTTGGGVGTSGGGTGELGAPCAIDSDCTQVPTSPDDATYDWVPYCKHTSISTHGTPFSYPSGYCTRRCFKNDQCGTGNRCLYASGRSAERDNFCVASCTGTCRSGYTCFSSGPAFCMPTAVATSTADAGPASTDASGGTCTSSPCNSLAESTCSQRGTASLCTAECDEAANPTTFCGPNSTCMLLLVQPDDAYGAQLRGFCTQSCDSSASVDTCGTGRECTSQNGCWFQ